MQKMSATKSKTDRTSLVVLASQNDRNGNDSLPQDLSGTVDVFEKHLERANPLLEPTHHLAPFVACENLGQQIAEPGIVVSTRGEFERHSEFTKRRVHPFFEFPQFGGSCPFQVADKLRIRRARLSSTHGQHFVPPFWRAITVLSVLFCHSGLLSVNWKPVVTQGRI
jgi:hypothetical protein